MFKKIIAAALVCLIAIAALAGCGYNPAVVMKVGERDVTCGEWLYFQYIAAKNAMDENEISSVKALLEATIEGKPAVEYLRDDTIENILKNIYIENEMKRLEIEFTSFDEYLATYYAEYYWNNYYSAALERNGVSYDSFRSIYITSYKYTNVFKNYYGEDGQFAVAKADVMAYYRENYAHVDYVAFPTSDKDSVPLVESEIDTLKGYAADIAGAVNGGTPLAEALVTYYPLVKQALGYAPKDSAITLADAEALITKNSIVNKESTTFAAGVISAMLVTETGEAASAVNEKNVYVYVRNENYKDEADFDENYYETALTAMRSDAFDEYITEQALKLDYSIDEKAVKYYSPKKII